MNLSGFLGFFYTSFFGALLNYGSMVLAGRDMGPTGFSSLSLFYSYWMSAAALATALQIAVAQRTINLRPKSSPVIIGLFSSLFLATLAVYSNNLILITLAFVFPTATNSVLVGSLQSQGKLFLVKLFFVLGPLIKFILFSILFVRSSLSHEYIFFTLVAMTVVQFIFVKIDLGGKSNHLFESPIDHRRDRSAQTVVGPISIAFLIHFFPQSDLLWTHIFSESQTEVVRVAQIAFLGKVIFFLGNVFLQWQLSSRFSQSKSFALEKLDTSRFVFMLVLFCACLLFIDQMAPLAMHYTLGWSQHLKPFDYFWGGLFYLALSGYVLLTENLSMNVSVGVTIVMTLLPPLIWLFSGLLGLELQSFYKISALTMLTLCWFFRGHVDLKAKQQEDS